MIKLCYTLIRYFKMINEETKNLVQKIFLIQITKLIN